MYKIKICNYAFDNTYTNVRIFDSADSRDVFFDNLPGEIIESCNFNANDLINTTIVFRIDQYDDISKLLNYNYCVVKNNDNPNAKPLYFWIKNSSQLSGGQFSCNLTIDFFMTYYYDIEFSDCIINRAHLDRFVKDADGTYSFDYSKNSKLFEREQIQDVSKRLVKREKMHYYDGDSFLERFLNENVECWLYIYMDPGEYNGIEEKEPYGEKKYSVNPVIYKGISYGVSCFCFPIMKSSIGVLNKIYVKTELGNIVAIGTSPLTPQLTKLGGITTLIDVFLSKNGNYTRVKSVKFSIMPPFNLNKKLNYESNTRGDIIISYDSIGGEILPYLKQDTGYKDIVGMLYKTSEFVSPITLISPSNFKLPQISGFTKTDITQNKKAGLNPKLNGADYKSVSINFNGSSYEYPVDKLNEKGQLKLTYYESIMPDVTRGICRIIREDNQTDEIYNSDYAESFSGLMFVQDLSLPIGNDQLSLYLANNKNAYLSFQNQQNKLWDDAILNSISNLFRGGMISAATESPVAGISGGIQAVTNLASTAIQYEYNQEQFNLTIDNMRNAPHTLQNVNGNAIFCNSVAELGIYVELYEAIDNELNIANDIMFENGFTYGRYGNIKDFVNTRKYFNYVQAIIDNIEGNISETIKQAFKGIFARGVRLWHTDKIDYNKENYEIFFDEVEA